jgi:hypothetical protein
VHRDFGTENFANPQCRAYLTNLFNNKVFKLFIRSTQVLNNSAPQMNITFRFKQKKYFTAIDFLPFTSDIFSI